MQCRKAVVLFKVVGNPEGNVRLGADGQIEEDHLTRVASAFDENAVEAALQLKDATKCKVAVLSVGDQRSEPTLRRTLAMGADEAILIEADRPACHGLDAARLLAAAIRRMRDVDVILSGRESADVGAGLVGPYVAQCLGIPFLTLAMELSLVDDSLKVRRPSESGYDIYICRPPFLLTVSGEANTPRFASVLKTFQAKKIPIQKLAARELDAGELESHPTPRVIARSLPTLDRKCTFIGGGTPAESAASLIATLRSEGAIP